MSSVNGIAHAYPASTAVNGKEATASSTTASISGEAATKPNNDPSEIGWLFVPNYYSVLNQAPDKLHRFYTKKSTLVHGVEQEDATPCFGQQDINAKILSLGFEDCKVFVSSVDSQASADGGIIIQVLGEMNNKDGPWRKFAQTFFLAEQPFGYFVLNDIFRYIKDEEDAQDEAQAIDDALEEEIDQAEHKGQLVSHAAEALMEEVAPAATPAPEPDVTPQAAPGPEKAPVEQKAAAEAAPAAVETAAPAEEQAQPADASESASTPSEPTAPAAAPISAPAPAATSTPVSASQTQAPPAAAAPAAPAAPAKPSAPKTWANLAASNVSKWGSGVTVEGRGATATTAPATSGGQQQQHAPNQQQQRSAAPKAAPTAQQPAHKAQGPGAAGRLLRGDEDASVFVKNVSPDRVQVGALKKVLSAYGTVLNLHMIPTKACAFADFASIDDAKRAIKASEASGGINVGNDGWTVIVEEKRKHDRTQGAGPGGHHGPRDGGPNGHRGQGGARGGRGGAPKQ